MADQYILASFPLVTAGRGYMPVHSDPPSVFGATLRSGATPTDRSLVQELAQGRQAALAQLFDRYATTLFAVALRSLGDRAEAEEAVLEAFTQAWRDAGRFDPARGSVGAWLTMMARSRALDRVRARVRHERATARAAADEPTHAPAMGVPSGHPEEAVEDDERRRRVGDALRTLPPEQREAIELAYYQGLSHSEIAARLDTPLGTVKTRIRTGMQKLRDALRPLVGEGAL